MKYLGQQFTRFYKTRRCDTTNQHRKASGVRYPSETYYTIGSTRVRAICTSKRASINNEAGFGQVIVLFLTNGVAYL